MARTRVHHAGHGDGRAGADREEQRVAGVSELAPGLLLDLLDGLGDLLLQTEGQPGGLDA